MIVLVEPRGPPSVITKMDSNILNASITSRIAIMKVVLESIGNVMLNQMVADGKYTVTWAFNHTPNVDAWRATVVTALTKYSVDPSDANWADVVTAFVDGWAIEYTMANG